MSYDFRADSSPDTDAYRQDPNIPADEDNPGVDEGAVVLLVGYANGGTFKLCGCGCSGKASSSKRTFLQGHDQRLIGILTRAYLNSAGVAAIDGGSIISGDAWSYARRTLTDRGLLKLDHAIKVGNLKASKRAETRLQNLPTSQPSWVPTADVKVGRWTYPAQRLQGTDQIRRNMKRDGTGAWTAV